MWGIWVKEFEKFIVTMIVKLIPGEGNGNGEKGDSGGRC